MNFIERARQRLSFSPRREVRAFLKAYRLWVLAGAPDSSKEIFRRKAGLCGNLLTWTLNRKLSMIKRIRAAVELREMFEADQLNSIFPFNEPGPGKSYVSPSFSAEVDEGTVWKNPQRVAWVKKHAA